MLPEAEPDAKGGERLLFVEVTRNDEGKDEAVLTISHLSLQDQQGQAASEQTSAPGAETTKPPRGVRG